MTERPVNPTDKPDRYDPQAIEARWRDRWETDDIYRATVDWDKPKHYAVTMLPYPSGDLHIGHWFAMTPSDARARYMRMRGYNVLFPMGFDAFGLPAENAAIKHGAQPARWTYANIERMRAQMRMMGTMFDWQREAVSCDPSYYKWSQWFFKKFYESGLAYRGEAMVNWSEALQTVLANEQVIDGKDERTGQPVVQKLMTQWFFKITKYADELLDFSGLDWPDPVKIMQTNWIGRSEGAHVTFTAEDGTPIRVFTTRPDTLWGATFMVIAPEHPLVASLTTDDQRPAVDAYVSAAARLTEIDRQSDDRPKTGVFTGGYALNPVTNERIPVWIADYVLISYGSGAIMAVPAHDERDFAFARTYGLEIRPVIRPDDADESFCRDAAYTGVGRMIASGHFDGTFSNGEKGRKNPAIAAVIDWLSERGIGSEAVNYRLRDWLISRQRYWGSPIPMIYQQDGTIASVTEDHLPVELPLDIAITGIGNPLGRHAPFVETTDADGNPARRETDTMDTFMCSSWYQYRYLSPAYADYFADPEEAAYWLPVDTYTGGAEHATMHLLYTRFFTKAMRDLGMFAPVEDVMRAHGRDPQRLFDEPMLQLRNQGQILGEERPGDFVNLYGRADGDAAIADRVVVSPTPSADALLFGELLNRTDNTLTIARAGGAGVVIVTVAPDAVIDIPHIPGENNLLQLREHTDIQRMSKSRGNVVNPDDLVRQYGADSVRAYLMFGFDWTKGGPWNSQNIQGVVRWLNEVWDTVTAGAPDGDGDAEVNRDLERKLHQTIKKVGDDIESFGFNTAIAALMTLKNDLRAALRAGGVGAAAWHSVVDGMIRMMAPITPYIAEELWARIGGGYSVHQQRFPAYDANKAAESVTTLIVMRNGKVVDRVSVSVAIAEDDAKAAALATAGAQRLLEGGKTPTRVIYIAGRDGVEPKVNIVL